MDELEQEFANALKEGRQPNCVYCKKPLEVFQAFCDAVTWRWNKRKKKYKKDEGRGDADKPECESCGARSWDLVGQSEVGRKLGLDY